MENSSHGGCLVRNLRRVVAASAGVVCAALVLTPGTSPAQSPNDDVTEAGPAELVTAGNYDYNGDDLDDVVARRNPGGNLEIWAGDGSGGFSGHVTVGTGWGAMNLIETAGDLNSDGKADLIAREASTGALNFYAGTGSGFAPAVRIGRGWEVMSAIVSGHDYNGDGKTDFLAVDATTGFLWLYPGTGTGTHGVRFKIGSSFNQVRDLTAVGDLDEDGLADIVAVGTNNECMYFYAGPGDQGFKPRVLFDCGWSVMDSAASVGDFDGDGHADWIGRETATGVLYLFKGNGTGSYGASPALDSGWNTMTIA
jgi:hypothetical protein